MRLGDRLRSTLDINKIYGFISATLVGSFHTKATAILVKNIKEEKYEAAFNNGFQLGDERLFLENKSLFDRLFRYSEPIIVEELKTGLRPEDAAALDFLSASERAGHSLVRIIVGKGIHSAEGPVLGSFVRGLLDDAGYVFRDAKITEGAQGAIDVKL